jgi:hypothetical protein
VRRALLTLLSVALLLCISSVSRAADDVKDVINKAIKAHGGKETMKKLVAAKATNKGKITLPGVGETDFKQEVAYMLPDKFKESIELDIGGMKIEVVTIANGDKLSMEQNGKEIKLTDGIKKALKDARYMLKISRLVPLVEDKAYKLESLGEIKVEDKPTLGVRVTSKGEKDVNLYFYKNSGLLAKIEYRSVNPMTETEYTEERIVVEYQEKKVDGVAVPKTVLVKHDGKQFLKAEVDMKYLEKVDDSEFSK